MVGFNALKTNNVSRYLDGLHSIIFNPGSKRQELDREDEYNLRVLHGRVPGLDFVDRVTIQKILEAQTGWKPEWDDEVHAFKDVPAAKSSIDRLIAINENPFTATPEEIKELIDIVQGKRDFEVDSRFLPTYKQLAGVPLQSLRIDCERLAEDALLANLRGVPLEEEKSRQESIPEHRQFFYSRDWNNRLLTKFGSIQNTRMLLPSDGKAGLINMLGFQNLDEFKSFIADKKHIVDLGSGFNSFAKSLHLLGLNNVVYPVNPVKRFLEAEGQEEFFQKNLNIPMKVMHAAETRLREIDEKTIDQEWGDVEFPEKIDLLLSTDAFPKFCATKKEAKQVVDRIYDSLKPGGIAIFSPLHDNDGTEFYKNSPISIDNFKKILDASSFKDIDIKQLPNECSKESKRTYYRILVRK